MSTSLVTKTMNDLTKIQELLAGSQNHSRIKKMVIDDFCDGRELIIETTSKVEETIAVIKDFQNHKPDECLVFYGFGHTGPLGTSKKVFKIDNTTEIVTYIESLLIKSLPKNS